MSKILGACLSIVLLFVGGPSGLAGQLETARHPTNPGQYVTMSDLEEAILKEVSRRFDRPQHRVSVHVLFPNKPIGVQRGKIHLEVGDLSGGRTGRRAFRVKVFVSDRFVRTVNVSGELKVKAEVASPVRWITPKEVLKDEDLELVSMDVPSLTHDFVLGLEEVVGKQALRPLPPHQPIRRIMLDSPPVIQKGDRVLIEVRGDGLLVQTVGLAKASGKTGDTIPVQNQSSGREVLGTVQEAGVVEVPF